MHSDILISSYMWLRLNIFVFRVWLSKGENEKNEMVWGDTCPLNHLEVTSARGGGPCIKSGRFNNNGHCLWLHFCDESDHWSPVFGGQGLFLPTLAYASFVPDVPGTHAQLAVCYRTEEWELGSCNCTKSWNWLN